MTDHPFTTRTATAAAAAVLALGGGAVVALAGTGAAGAATGWSPTATKALSLVHATKLGAADPGQALRLTIGLTPRDASAIPALIKAQTAGTAGYLTPTQFRDRFGATPAAASAVTSYLSAQGMRNVTVSSNRLQVTADATVAQAEKAFDTGIARYSQSGKTIIANTATAQVPASLAGDVTAVLGLSNLGMVTLPPITAPNLSGYYPKEFNTVYDSWGTKAGDGTTLAVIAQGSLTQTVKDLRYAEAKQHLPQVPVSLRYSGIKSPDTAGAVEWDLDTQTSTGIAPNAKRLYIYIATTLTDSDLARAINQFATEDVAKSGNASLGECDALASLDGSTTIDDIAFAQAAVQGQTFFASSGDTGSSCPVAPTNGVPASGPPDTSYPASSQYVLGVGGTTLAATAGTDQYQGEIAWNAGGGGVSPIEYSPYWQHAVNIASNANLRGVPDVAFDADPTTGANIYVTSAPTLGGPATTAPETVGGTSLSSPLAMGLWTRLQATHANKLGFAPPKLYNYYTKTQNGVPLTAVPGFHDIVAGGNGTYTALPGYDFTTGLGSWDLGKLSGHLK